MVCSCCRGSCRSSARLSAKPESGQGNWTNFACRSTGCGNWRNILETDTSAFELDKPLPDFVLARPKLEGAQSRADLIIELAQRESLTVREILSRLGGGRGHFTFIGTPDQVVDTIVAWFEGGAADGFNIMAAALPSGLETFIDHVLPILRRKGLFREDYVGATLREHYGLPVPANQFHRSGA